MSEPRGPVRHNAGARRPAPTRQPTLDDGEPSGDLQSVFTTLARRAKLPTGPNARPTEVLRSAGLPLLLAAIVAGGHPMPKAVADAEGAPQAPAAPQAVTGGQAGWTVTQLTPDGAAPAAAPVTVHSAQGPTAKPAAQPAAKTADQPAVKPSTPSVKLPAAPPVSLPSAPSVTLPGIPSLGKPAAKPATTSVGKATGSSATPIVPAVPVPIAGQLTYTVRPGDSLATIAKLTGRPVHALIAVNKLPQNGMIKPGQVLVLTDPTSAGVGTASTKPSSTKPSSAKPSTPAVQTAPKPGGTGTAAATRPYTVRSGDSLAGISESTGVPLGTVLSLNHLHRGSAIHPGQVLLLPAAAKTDDPPSNASTGHGYQPTVIAASAANRKALAGAKVPTHDQVKAMIVSTARSFGVDPALALGLAYQESGFDQRTVSAANAVGVMQVVPSTGKWASGVVGHPLDLLDAKDNITAGVALLAALTRSADTEAQAIAGYYQGLASVRAHGMFDDTRRYVATVQTLKTRFGAGG